MSIVSNFADAESALRHLLQNRGVPTKRISKLLLKDAIQYISNKSIQGLSSREIKTICESIVFVRCYDINKRKRLLHSCIPAASEDFPYEIIPLAVSSFNFMEEITFGLSVLQWICGLLQYKIVDKDNIHLRICYSSFFYLMEIPQLSQWASHIVYLMTMNCDITPCRVSSLLELEKKPWGASGSSYVLRIFHTYRPDLVVLRSRRLRKFPVVPQRFKEGLMAAYDRKEEAITYSDVNDDNFWPDVSVIRKANPYADPTCIPYPDFTVYADTIEKRKETSIPILQYRSINHMKKDLKNWKKWQWPNNTASLLVRPSVMVLFRPHDVEMKVSLFNWLDTAIRAEVVNERGSVNPLRPISLLKAMISTLKAFQDDNSIVYWFLTDFFATWDYYSYVHLILEIVKFVPLYSVTYFLQDIFKPLCRVMFSCSLPLWCETVDSISNIIVSWAMQNDRQLNSTGALYYQSGKSDKYPVAGIQEICCQMDRVFMASLQHHGSSLIVISTIINFYLKVNRCSKFFQLPLFVFPPLEFIFVVLASGHLTALDQLGHLFVDVQSRAAEVKHMSSLSPLQTKIRTRCLAKGDSINKSVMVFLDALTSHLAFSVNWLELLRPFLSKKVLKQLTSKSGVSSFLCMNRSLAFSSISRSIGVSTKKDLSETEVKQLISDICKKLVDHDLRGIYLCISAYFV